MDPIELFSALRMFAADSVVTEGQLSDLQQSLYVEDPAATWLCESIEASLGVRHERSQLYLLTGNAGDGKSMLIEAVTARIGHREGLSVLADATHAESPSRTQAEGIARRLEPFSDDAPGPGEVVLAAMNVGMAVRFFDHTAEGEKFRGLRAVVLAELGVSKEKADRPQLWGCTVVDLGQRSIAKHGPAGGPSVLELMLGRLSQDVQGEVAVALEACDNCAVRASCFVATNLRTIRTPVAKAALRSTLAESTLLTGQHLTPRAAWDWFARVIAGGGDGPRTCAEMCAWVEDSAPAEVAADALPKLVPNSALRDLGASGAVSRVADSDPIARASLASYDDEMSLMAWPEALADRFDLLAREVSPDPNVIDLIGANLTAPANEAGQTLSDQFIEALPRFTYFLGAPAPLVEALRPRDLENFEALLSAYAELPVRPSDAEPVVGEFHEKVLVPGLQRMFGLEIGGATYLRQGSVTAQSRMIAHAAANIADLVSIRPPVSVATDGRPEAARNSPGSLIIDVSDLIVEVDLALWRLLKRTVSGGRPAAADREQYYRLTYALERCVATDAAEMLFRQSGSGRLLRLRSTSDFRGPKVELKEFSG